MQDNLAHHDTNNLKQVFLGTPMGNISFQPIKLGCIMKLAKYRIKDDRRFCCTFIYYSQPNFPRNIKLKLIDIKNWTDTQIIKITQNLLEFNNLLYTMTELSKIKIPVQYYKTLKKLFTGAEFLRNTPGLYEKCLDSFKLVLLMADGNACRPVDQKLMEIGWPPSMELTMEEIIELTSGDPPLTKTQIKKYLLKRFNNEIFSTMLKSWAEIDLFGKRINILKDAISAHNIGQYSLSVPVLLAQCEGIIASLAGFKGRKCQRDIVEAAKNMSKNVLLHESFLNTLTDSFFEEFEFGQNNDKFFTLGRNSILHGINLEYATAENSLKSILLIDFLFEITKSVQRNNNNSEM